MKLYQERLTSAEEAARKIVSDSRVYLGGGVGAPQTVIDALVKRAPELRNVELIHILHFGKAEYVKPEYAQSFRHNAMFIGHNVRSAVQQGHADFTPVFLSEIPSLFRDGHVPLDIAIVQVSPPDEHGFCSLGAEVGCTKGAAEHAKFTIAEVNKQVPRTLGDSFLHVRNLDMIVVSDYPLPEASQGGASETLQQIGKIIANLIPNGATLQMGIGSIPDAVLNNLHNHKDLGIHSELFSDGVVDLIEAGIINGAKKTLHPGKVIAGFILGSKRLYDYVDNNPIIELHPTDYVNDPFIIAQNDNMISINSAIEVDLTGQVAADSIGTRFYSGVGGQLDFVRGASRSKGGKPFIALPSTAKNGALSRIVPMLKPGSGVTTTRNDAPIIVTEYGYVETFGKTIRERAQGLINIAAPEFREELTQKARELNYL
ncbi:MAG: acetyl-CoA hydrolase/transferase family protein [Calditrichaeota bacterium]|nr:acetyl-CoA hydrolase/transferase family protein [Calditrichota bacterium]